MGRIQREIVVGAAPAAVFAYLSEPERLAEWTPGVLAVRRTSAGPVGVGSTTETDVEVLGVRQTLLGRCTAFEPARRLSVENRSASALKIGGITIGGVMTTSTSDLLPEGAGTRLRAALTYQLDAGFLSGVAEQVAGPRIEADFDQSLRNLKAILDRQAAPGG